jgi:VanZ family protein
MSARLAFWVCVAAIVALAVWPTSHPLPSTGWDKTNHLLAFCTLAFVGGRAYPVRLAVLSAGLMTLGGVIELLQWCTPDRHAEWGDLLADAVGIAMGIALLTSTRKKSRA